MYNVPLGETSQEGGDEAYQGQDYNYYEGEGGGMMYPQEGGPPHPGMGGMPPFGPGMMMGPGGHHPGMRFPPGGPRMFPPRGNLFSIFRIL